VKNQEPKSKPADSEQRSGKGLLSTDLLADVDRLDCPTCDGTGSILGCDLDGFFPGSGKEADLTYLCPQCDGNYFVPANS